MFYFGFYLYDTKLYNYIQFACVILYRNAEIMFTIFFLFSPRHIFYFTNQHDIFLLNFSFIFRESQSENHIIITTRIRDYVCRPRVMKAKFVETQ